jgi:hypothetical protein
MATSIRTVDTQIHFVVDMEAFLPLKQQYVLLPLCRRELQVSCCVRACRWFAGGLRVPCQLHPACSFHLHRFEQLNYMTSVSWRHPGALQSLRAEARAFKFVCVGKSGLVSGVAVHRVTVICVGLVRISDGDLGTNCATGGWCWGKYWGPNWEEVTEDWRKLHHEELHDWYCLRNIIRVIRSSMIRWVGHVACIMDRNVYWVLVGKREGKRRLWVRKHRWECDVNRNCAGIGEEIMAVRRLFTVDLSN